MLNQAGVSVEAVRLAAVESGISCHNNGLAHRHLAALQQQKQQLAAQVQQLQVWPHHKRLRVLQVEHFFGFFRGQSSELLRVVNYACPR